MFHRSVPTRQTSASDDTPSATLCDMATTISHREMRNNSAEVLRRVEAGESFTITNHGEPVAELSPMRRSILDELEAKGQLRRATETWESLAKIKRIKLPDGVTTADIIADVRGYDRGY